MRICAGVAVIALHVALLLLLMAGLRIRVPEAQLAPVFASLLVMPVVRERAREVELAPSPEPLAPRAFAPPVPVEVPLPAAEPVQPAGPATRDLAAPGIDWAREASRAAARATEQPGGGAAEFSAPAKALREPCKPRETHMEWNGHEDRRVGLSGGLPYVRLGNCVVGLGFFGCALGPSPGGNGEILDDRKDPDRSTSSVPDPNLCD